MPALPDSIKDIPPIYAVMAVLAVVMIRAENFLIKVVCGVILGGYGVLRLWEFD